MTVLWSTPHVGWLPCSCEVVIVSDSRGRLSSREAGGLTPCRGIVGLPNGYDPSGKLGGRKRFSRIVYRAAQGAIVGYGACGLSESEQ